MQYLSGYYQVAGADGSSFGVYVDNGRGGVGTRTTQFSSQKNASYVSREGQVSVDSGSHKTFFMTGYQKLQRNIRARGK